MTAIPHIPEQGSNYRLHPQAGFNFDELVIDNFAGGGGASTGIEQALGRPVDIAINHDLDAVRMHETNHPHTKHYCESVWEVDPREVTKGRPVGLCWFSPDCKHFSKAKGGAPVSKRVRGLAWIMCKWAGSVAPRIMMTENVEEFKSWGPLITKRCKKSGRVIKIDGSVAAPGERVPLAQQQLTPNRKRMGKTFRRLVRNLEGMGYVVEWKELVASEYGTPTTRKRLFMVARRDGKPICWPQATHGHPQSPAVLAGDRKPQRTIAEVIDWSIPCPSIFTRSRPLVANTLGRLARGVTRFVIENPNPFIIEHHAPFITECANGSSQRNMAANDPMRTLCAQVKGGHFAVVAPIIERQFSRSNCNRADEPLATITAGGGGKAAVCAAFITKHNGGATGHGMDDPLHTVTGRGTQMQLTTSHLIKLRGTCQHGQPVTDPAPTITSGGLHIGEVRTLLEQYCPQPGELDYGLLRINGELYRIVDIGMRMLQPHELFAAMGFPADYIIDRDFNGQPFTKTAQIARCGNAVCPDLAEALVRANMVESQQQAVAA